MHRRHHCRGKSQLFHYRGYPSLLLHLLKLENKKNNRQTKIKVNNLHINKLMSSMEQLPSAKFCKAFANWGSVRWRIGSVSSIIVKFRNSLIYFEAAIDSSPTGGICEKSPETKN